MFLKDFKIGRAASLIPKSRMIIFGKDVRNVDLIQWAKNMKMCSEYLVEELKNISSLLKLVSFI